MGEMVVGIIGVYNGFKYCPELYVGTMGTL